MFFLGRRAAERADHVVTVPWHVRCSVRDMREVVITVVVALVAATVAVGVDSPDQSRAADAGRADCVKVRAEVRVGAIGYDHVVHLRNVCDHTWLCAVKTDIDASPGAVQVAVPPRFEVEAVTSRGSPTRTFVPSVACRPK